MSGYVVGLGLLLFVLGAWLSWRHDRYQVRMQRAAMPQLESRDACDVKDLVATLQDTPRFENELVRIWLGLSKNFGLPPGSIRPDDELGGLLAPWVGDADNALCFVDRRLAGDLGASTWGDLVTVVHQRELGAGDVLVPWPSCARCGYLIARSSAGARCACPECGTVLFQA